MNKIEDYKKNLKNYRLKKVYSRGVWDIRPQILRYSLKLDKYIAEGDPMDVSFNRFFVETDDEFFEEIEGEVKIIKGSNIY